MSNTKRTNKRESNSEGYKTRIDTYIGLAIGGALLVLPLILSSVSGFGPYDGISREARAPTLWDWMELLIVPAVLALGALWFNTTQKETELEIAEKARDVDREIAEARQGQATLEAYYDRMTELLLMHNLRQAKEDAEKRSIARARTVAVVRSLDGGRNRELFAFLQASKLMEPEAPIIDLSRIDFSNTHLSGANLSGANLSGANLSGANLSGAKLHHANLNWADLSGADLSGADLTGANLRSTKLFGTDLRWTKLLKTDLSRANLSDADLSGANLSGANLSEARLRWANLSGANLTIEQMEQAEALKVSIMPNGVQLGREETEYQERIVGPTFEEWKAQYQAKQTAEKAYNEPNSAADGQAESGSLEAS